MPKSKNVIETQHLRHFIGEDTVAVDAAGRTNFPKEFRKVLRAEAGGQVVVTIAGDRTLALFPIYEWNSYMTYMESLGRGPEVAKFRARVTGMAKLSTLDAQNRIALTREQMEYAGLAGTVTFVGDGAKTRLWNPERYVRKIKTITPAEEKQYENWY